MGRSNEAAGVATVDGSAEAMSEAHESGGKVRPSMKIVEEYEAQVRQRAGQRRPKVPAWPTFERTSPSSTNDPLPDEKRLEALREIGALHVDSYNYALGDGLQYAVNDLLPKTHVFKSGSRARVWLENVRVHRPMRNEGSETSGNLLYPAEARELAISYSARMTGVVCLETTGGVQRVEKVLGHIPVMVCSELCNLSGAGPKELVRHSEDGTEFGGYFICNGLERLIRLLQIPRRNHIMALQRPSFKNRGRLFTDKAVVIRCVGPDQTGNSVTLHYLRDGTASVRIGIRKAEYFIPVVLLLKALKGPMATDKEIYTSVLRGAHLAGDTFVSDRCELSLRQVADLRLYTAKQCRAYLGSQFRTVLYDVSDDMSDEEAGMVLLRKHIFTHLNMYSCEPQSEDVGGGRLSFGTAVDEDIGIEKFNLLIEMLRKLYAFVSGKVASDNSDALNNHELLLGGHLYGAMLKERLDQYLSGLRFGFRREETLATSADKLAALENGDIKTFRRMLDKQGDIGKKLFYFLSTGNLVSESGLDLMQAAGFTIIAEKLNRYRFLSHFRSVHRGQFFTTMKTTAVRKLLPESYGFLCPVHTPDGTPCGLLNHLAAHCAVVTHQPPMADVLSGYTDDAVSGQGSQLKKKDKSKKGSRRAGGSSATSASLTPTLLSSASANTLVSALSQLLKNLVEWGVTPVGPRSSGILPPHDYVPVMVDGRVVGYAPAGLLEKTVVPRLRRAKAAALRIDAAELKQRSPYEFNTARVLRELYSDPHALYAASIEVCFTPPSVRGGAYSGLFLFTQPGRMVRPVVHLESGLVELVGPMAQTFMEIAVRPEEVRFGVDSHCELWPTSMLSIIASLTPFSDFNQSPRNMYQCQMGKQTMGTPAHNLKHRTDTKLYRIQTPQAPLVQTAGQAVYSMDEYPNGTNAVVAVISYTGYDMEDAMILNKSSYERGFGHASVYKTKVIDLTQERGQLYFSNVFPSSHNKSGEMAAPELDIDGLPHVGDMVKYGSPIASYVDEQTGQLRIDKHKDAEPAVVEVVRVLATEGKGSKNSNRVRKVSITFRYNRNPVVGDKFSSRHGQKGVLSILWPQEDMPFTESGMSPDVIINPHAFPSRMTIGMLIESMAGKAGAMHGVYQDATPFTMQGDTENETAVDFFGEQLRAAGYNYFGSEPLYSGIQGTEMKADIYIGVVYYQRLRHMVSDKSQVRSLGPIDPVTRQPVKGRKRMGGVRFGEMERDSLIAHGTAFLMRDRMLNCSDRHVAFVCCGSILGVHNLPQPKAAGRPADADIEAGEDELPTAAASDEEEDVEDEGKDDEARLMRPATKLICRSCKRSDRWYTITIPFVFRYLANELAAMGIKLEIQ